LLKRKRGLRFRSFSSPSLLALRDTALCLHAVVILELRQQCCRGGGREAKADDDLDVFFDDDDDDDGGDGFASFDDETHPPAEPGVAH